MAQQHTVRALVPAGEEAEIRRALDALPRAGVLHVDSRRPAPATYRDEQPDRRLRQLWQASRAYLILGAAVGALVGAVVGAALLTAWLPYSAVVLAFGFAWGGAAFGWGRGAQVAKREDDLGEERIDLGGRDAQDLRLLTIEVQRDREQVADLLVERGATLVDAQHPVVGDAGPLARPDRGGTPEGQRAGDDGAGGHVERGRGAGPR